jgi:hypothetical protein
MEDKDDCYHAKEHGHEAHGEVVGPKDAGPDFKDKVEKWWVNIYGCEFPDVRETTTS